MRGVSLVAEMLEMKRVLPPMYAASSDKYLICMSILLCCPLAEKVAEILRKY